MTDSEVTQIRRIKRYSLDKSGRAMFESRTGKYVHWTDHVEALRLAGVEPQPDPEPSEFGGLSEEPTT